MAVSVTAAAPAGAAGRLHRPLRPARAQAAGPRSARAVRRSALAAVDASQLTEAANFLQCLASLSVTAVALLAARRLLTPSSSEEAWSAGWEALAEEEEGPAFGRRAWGGGRAGGEPVPAQLSSARASEETDELSGVLGEFSTQWLAAADAGTSAPPPPRSGEGLPPTPVSPPFSEDAWQVAVSPLRADTRAAPAPAAPDGASPPAKPSPSTQLSSPLPPLLLLALSIAPRRALLTAALEALRITLPAATAEASASDSTPGADWWSQRAFAAVRDAIPLAALRWAAAEEASGALRPRTLSAAAAAGEGAEADTPFQLALRDSAEDALSPMAMGGRAALYGSLASALASGGGQGGRGASFCAVLLQDASVLVAEAVAAAYVSWARGEPGTPGVGADGAPLPPSFDASFANRALLLPRLRATRSLERFRNEVALSRWTHSRFGGVREVVEDRQPLWGIGREGALRRRAVALPRRGELDGLEGMRRSVSLGLEASDVVGPLLQRLWRRLSALLSFLLVQLIGRALGLVARGIRQSLRGGGGGRERGPAV